MRLPQHGESMSNAPVGETPWHRIKVPKDPAARKATVENYAHNIVNSYLAGTPEQRSQGEEFYSHEASGSARSIAAAGVGVDPDSAVGHLFRTTRASDDQVSLANDHPVAERQRHNIRQAAGALARLSPQTSWELNVKQAHEASHLPQETVDELKKTGNREGLEGLHLNRQPTANVLAAHAMLHDEMSPEESIPTGKKRQKVGSFFENIVDPHNSPHTTVDFRAHDISVGRLLDTNADRGLSSRGRYDLLSDAHDRARDILNEHYPSCVYSRNPFSQNRCRLRRGLLIVKTLTGAWAGPRRADICTEARAARPCIGLT